MNIKKPPGRYQEVVHIETYELVAPVKNLFLEKPTSVADLFLSKAIDPHNMMLRTCRNTFNNSLSVFL